MERQNENAQGIAEFLSKHSGISQAFYPGLLSHPGHEIARKQMSGYGGILSFEIKNHQAHPFMRKLQLIKPILVESTICDPSTTSHRHLSTEQKTKDGISDNLLRLSVGIENIDDILCDLDTALK